MTPIPVVCHEKKHDTYLHLVNEKRVIKKLRVVMPRLSILIHKIHETCFPNVKHLHVTFEKLAPKSFFLKMEVGVLYLQPKGKSSENIFEKDYFCFQGIVIILR